MNKINHCFVVVIVGVVLAPTFTTADYYISKDKKSFIGAWIGCKTGDMDLASIKSDTQQAAINSTISKSTVNGEEGYWIGGVAEDVLGDWFWTDTSTKMFYENWGYDQPRTYGDEQEGGCLRQGNFYEADEPYKWQSVDCKYELYYICEYNA